MPAAGGGGDHGNDDLCNVQLDACMCKVFGGDGIVCSTHKVLYPLPCPDNNTPSGLPAPILSLLCLDGDGLGRADLPIPSWGDNEWSDA